ncbi:MAG: hypothetical protein ACI8TA_001596 [Cyclobacteriaceae bacterium]|jgi:hypothetical protein
MLQNLENMEIVKLLGGMGVILATVLTAFYRIFILRVKSTWDKRTNKEIELLKQELTRNNTTLNNIQSNYLTQVQAVSTKRLEAIELLWKSCLIIRDSIPTHVFPILSVFPEEYINMERLNTPNPGGTELGKELGKLDIDVIMPILESSKSIQQYRPFIPIELYTLYKTYTSVVSGAIFNAITKFKKGTITHWKNEDSIKKLLQEVLTEKEIEHIYSLYTQSFQSLLELMELKIIESINKSLSGEGTTLDSIEQLKKIESILTFNNENEGA